MIAFIWWRREMRIKEKKDKRRPKKYANVNVNTEIEEK